MSEYLGGNTDHPRNIHVRVLPNRFFNGPHGEHVRSGATTYVAECELEPNRSIFAVVDSDEDKAAWAKFKAQDRDATEKASGKRTARA